MSRIGWNTSPPPEVEEQYLCTLDTGDLCVCAWVCGYYVGGTMTLPGQWHWACPQYTKVVAWMLLPEPFKPDNLSYDGER